MDETEMNTEDISSKCILYVEDDPFILETTEAILRKLGYDVGIAINAEEAIKLFTSQSNRFDLVITDMNLPEMDGIELTKTLMAIDTAIPVILCTGFGAQVDDQRLLDAGIRPTIGKPYSIGDLAEVINKVFSEGKGIN